MLATTEDVGVRVPHFCSGCPHNTSTVVPEGSRAYAGIGCHYMALWMDRRTEGFTQMGAEGANWIGEAPFSTRDHVFQNLGDGTYSHSGTLAIRAAAAAGVNITYKILFNDAVAMTGGQPVEGHLTVDKIARQVAAEGAKRIALVSDDPHKYPAGTSWPKGMTIHHRSQFAEVQEELAKVKGLSVLIYDQTCAAEKRRRRKRGLAPDPDKRVIINTLVCEGCGDCGVKSNCVSIQPLETEFGRKRTIDQSSCNKDYSCIEGFCPSFVTVHGAKLKAGTAIATDSLPPMPEPTIEALERTRGILITGVGRAPAIVTVGAMLGMAAHLDGLGVGIIDMAGLAQKGGAVSIHMRIGPTPDAIHSIRIAAEEADTVLACDIVVAGSRKALAAIRPGESRVFVNLHETYPGRFHPFGGFFAADPPAPPGDRGARRGGARALRRGGAAGERARRRCDRDQHADGGVRLAAGWHSDQPRVDPRSDPAERRLGGHEPRRLRMGTARRLRPRGSERLAGLASRTADPTFAELVERRAAFLTAYQNAGYASHYRSRVLAIAAAEERAAPGEDDPRDGGRTFALQADGHQGRVRGRAALHRRRIRQAASRAVRSWDRLEFNLAPPLLASRDRRTGHLKKQRFGGWMFSAFRILAWLKFLRGTFLDPFRRAAERRWERRATCGLRERARHDRANLSASNRDVAMALAAYPRKIRRLRPCEAGAGAAGARRARAAAEGVSGAQRAARRGGGVKQLPACAPDCCELQLSQTL